VFSLFLNDIEMHLQEIINVGTIIYPGSIYLLLFADDAVLRSEDAHLGYSKCSIVYMGIAISGFAICTIG